jgi:hypothetical protein
MVDAGVAAQGAMQLRGAHLDLSAAVALGFAEKTRQRLPEIFSIKHPFLIPQAAARRETGLYFSEMQEQPCRFPS